MRLLLSGIYFCGLACLAAAADRDEVSWPTPSTAFSEGKSSHTFLQHAGSGDPASGGFGGVRSQGRQFHEGLDLKPVERRRRGEGHRHRHQAQHGQWQDMGTN